MWSRPPQIHYNDKGGPSPVHALLLALIIVSGEGITPRTYDLANLQAMKQETFDASSSTSNTVGIWTDPRWSSVLKASGVDTKDMDSYVVVQATDGYAAVLSMYEATHMTGTQYALLAIEDTLGRLHQLRHEPVGKLSAGKRLSPPHPPQRHRGRPVGL